MSDDKVGAHQWLLDDIFRFTPIFSAGLSADEQTFLHAMQSMGIGDARKFSRMSRAKRAACMADMERRGRSVSGQMKKYARLWETYTALRVVAKLSRS